MGGIRAVRFVLVQGHVRGGDCFLEVVVVKRSLVLAHCWLLVDCPNPSSLVLLPSSFRFGSERPEPWSVSSLYLFFFCPNFFHDFCMLKFRLMLDLRRFRLGTPMKQLTECTLCSDCGERRTRFANTSTSGIIFSWLVFRRRRRIGSKSVIRWQVVVIGNS